MRMDISDLQVIEIIVIVVTALLAVLVNVWLGGRIRKDRFVNESLVESYIALEKNYTRYCP